VSLVSLLWLLYLRPTGLVNNIRRLTEFWTGLSASTRGATFGFILFIAFIICLQFPYSRHLYDEIVGAAEIAARVRHQQGLAVGTLEDIEVVLSNSSNYTASIVGLSRSCRCVTLPEDFIGRKIQPGGEIKLPLKVLPEQSGVFHQRVVLYLNHPKQFRLNVDVLGFVGGEI
jgi:hypothetical protein